MREERTISIKALFLASCRSWRKMLLFGLVFAVLGGGFKAYKSVPKQAPQVVSEDAGPSEEKGSSVDYKKNAESMKKQIEAKSEYLNDSILGKIDPYNEGRATADFVVSTEKLDDQLNAASVMAIQTEGTDNADNTDQQTESPVVITEAEENAQNILRAYNQYLIYRIDFTEIAEKYQTSPKYLSEIISTSQLERAKPTLEIRVIYPNAEGAEEILATVIAQLQSQHERITAESGEHQLLIENQMASTVVDNSMLRWMTDRTNELNNLISARDNFTTATNALGYTAPAKSAQKISKKSLIKPILKFAVAGGVAGIVIFIIGNMVILLLTGRIVDARELNRQYHFKKLAVIPTKKITKLAGLDRLIYQDVLSYLTSGSENDSYQIAADTLCKQADGDGKIAVCGAMKEKDLHALIENLRKHTDQKGQLILIEDMTSPAALKKLDLASSVVIAAKLEEASYEQVDRILEIVENNHKKILGSMVLV